MASLRTIQLDFAAANAQATHLEELAGEIGRLQSDQLGGALEELYGYWQGASSESFQKKGRELQHGLQNTEKDLYAVARNIRAVARRIYNAEMTALRIAQERTF